MNERILELAKQADLIQWDTLPSGARTPDHESVAKAMKFAESIIRECAEQVSRTTEADSILEHFGIEEGREEEVFSCPACGLQNPTTTCGLPNCGLIY
jgi:hypothetical protein